MTGQKEPEVKSNCEIFCNIIVALMIDWISGKARYRSLTEYNIETVQKLYEGLLPDEPPSAQRLFNKFNMPPAQAAYIARVLRDKEQARWRIAALRELRETIHGQAEATKCITKNAECDENVQFEIIQGASRELRVICNDIKKKEKARFDMPTHIATVGEFHRWKCTVATLRRIEEHLFVT